MNETSLQAYSELKAQRKLQPMELKVLQDLASRPRTRDDIAWNTGLRLSSVCGRVNSLLKAGLIEEFTTVTSFDTGKKVNLLRLIEDDYKVGASCL